MVAGAECVTSLKVSVTAVALKALEICAGWFINIITVRCAGWYISVTTVRH